MNQADTLGTRDARGGFPARWLSALITCTWISLPTLASAQASGEQEPAGVEDAAPGASAQDAAATEDEGSAEEAPPDAVEPGAEQAEGDDADATADASAEVESGGGLFEAAVSGELDEVLDTGEPGGTGLPFALNGYIRSDLYIGKTPGYQRAELQAGYGELSLKVDVPRQDYGSAFAELRFRYGQQGDERTLFTDLREAYVNAYLGDFDLRLGKQIIVWGRADAFNPTNNLTPVDLRVRSPIEDDRRVGNVGARLFWNLLPLRLEGVWMPYYLPIEVPSIELPEGVFEAQPVYPTRPDLQNGTYAGRVHLQLASFETSLSYLHGYALMPGIDLASYVAGVPDSSVTIRRRAYEHDVIGFDFSTALAGFGVRGEAAYRQPFDYEEQIYTPRPDVQYVLGLDREFGQLSLIAQYVGRYTLDWADDDRPGAGSTSILPMFNPGPTVETSIRQELQHRNQILFQQLAELQHMVSLRAEWLMLHDTLSLSVLGFANVTTQEWLVFPKILYKFSDSMTGTLGGEIYYGPESTLFDLIEEELSAGYAELRFSF